MTNPLNIRQPQTELTLKRAEEGDRRLWVYESHDEVLKKVDEAENNGDKLVEFSRMKGVGNPGVPFATRPSNIVNVQKIAE